MTYNGNENWLTKAVAWILRNLADAEAPAQQYDDEDGHLPWLPLY